MMRRSHVVGALLCTLLSSVAANATQPPAAPSGAELILGPAAFASEASRASGCWARLYLVENFGGRALTLIGPVEVDYVRRDWGFAWDPRYKSLIVGPRATLTVYDDARLNEPSATFTSGRTISDLNREMGVFRNIGSMKVACS